MNQNSKEKKDREMPYTHFVLISTPIIFITVWILDSYIFKISVLLNRFIPFLVRMILFALIMVLGLLLIYLSHKTLFHENEPLDTLITDGILGRVRHPLYLGILLIYIAFIALSISLISIVLFIVIFLIFNKMANYEEKVLENFFGRQYLEYKKQVRKWIPKIF